MQEGKCKRCNDGYMPRQTATGGSVCEYSGVTVDNCPPGCPEDCTFNQALQIDVCNACATGFIENSDSGHRECNPDCSSITGNQCNQCEVVPSATGP